jgi:hypothetical protein
MYFLLLGCTELPLGPGGEEPNTMIIVSSVSPEDEQHQELTRTEIEVVSQSVGLNISINL